MTFEELEKGKFDLKKQQIYFIAIIVFNKIFKTTLQQRIFGKKIQ